MNSFLPLCDVFSFVFWKKLKTLKRQFKIIWLLVMPWLKFFKRITYKQIIISTQWLFNFMYINVCIFMYWDKEQQSKAHNSDSKYRQMALVGFDYSIVKDSSADLGVNFKIVQNRPTVRVVCTKISKFFFAYLSIFLHFWEKIRRYHFSYFEYLS